jgi:hypothetical protein
LSDRELLRLAGVARYEEANRYVETSYLEEHNRHFGASRLRTRTSIANHP